MKIGIQNLGAVNKATINLKPLTVFVGDNNSGKTWVAYTICGLFGKESWEIYGRKFSKGFLKERYPLMDEYLEQLHKKGHVKIDILDYFEKYGKKYYSNLAKFAPYWLNKTMGTHKKIFDKVKISVNIDDNFEGMKNYILSSNVDLSFPKGTDKKGLLNLKKSKNDPYLYVFFNENQPSVELPQEVINEFVTSFVFQLIHRSIYSSNLYLPAERTGIMTFLDAFRMNPNKSSSKPVKEKNIETDLNLPFPILKLMSELLELQDTNTLQRLSRIRTGKTYEKFNELANLLEGSILDGKFEYLDQNGKLCERLYYSHKKGNTVDLELAVASSTVKDIAPISLYLKYLVDPRDILLIDEPEMNLHPENQAKLMELLVMLIHLDVSIIMVTHSPYMVNHLENLIKAYPHKENEKIVNEFYLKDKNAFISKDKVSVYRFSNSEGNVENILDKKGNINLKSFSSVAEDIAEIYYDI